MEISGFFIKLKKLKIRIALDGDELDIKAPKGVLTRDLVEEIRNKKEKLIIFFKNENKRLNHFAISKTNFKEYYSLSSAQKRLYLLQEMEQESTAYNMPYIIPLGTDAEKEKIEEAFLQLIKRHESFRTSFEIEGEEPVQRIHEQVEFKLEEFEITKEEIQEKRQQFIQAFDLSQAPLLRVSKVDIKGESSLLMIDMHHIISDGASHSILEKEFQRLYFGEDLPPLSLQYKDYSEWQNSEEQQAKVKKQEDYWIKKFEEEIPVLDLPMDYVRPVMQSAEGSAVSFVLSKEETQNIKSLTKENDLTLYMSLLSMFTILLSKLSGQEDIIVGTPTAGRNHRDLENIVGMFVNTLAIRNEVDGSNTLKVFLEKLKQNTLEAFENQDYQFEDLVENISIERDISRNPVFDVMFNFQNQTDTKADLSGLESEQYVHRSGLSKFDLTLAAVDYGEQLMLSFEYCTKLFKAETIERYIGYFKQIVNQLTINSEKELSEIDILSAEEKQQLLYDFNDTKIDFAKDKAIHEIFEEQVKRTPNAYALVRGNTKLTYKEFNQEIDKLFNILINKGIKCNDFVVIFADQSIEFLISIFAVLKAGGAYVPIDDNYPVSRKHFIIKDCEAKIILSTKSVRSSNKEILKGIGEDQIVNVDELDNYEFSVNQDLIKLRPDNLIYLIYTSGSTGNPKGAAVYHKSFTNLLYWFINEYTITDIDSVLLMSSTSFDLTQKNLFASLLKGGSLHFLPTSHYDPDIISDIISREKITWINCTPSAFYPMVEVKEDFLLEQLNSLRFVFLGGEHISMNKLSSWLSLESNKTKIVNTYGPTEATDICASFIIENPLDYRDKIIPIGKPIYNVHIFILDKNHRIVPVGISGELCISGAGLALGYLNNIELTSDKFIAHPYKEGERLYKTGDLARWLPDGKIEFLGRIDHQVKIRGFRIELGEIESLLQKHEQIKDSVVIDREENGEKYLCAYLVNEENFSEEEIRSYLSASLPDYMIPSYIIELDEIPLTPNGKVNRKALPSPEIKAGDDYVAPSNAIEEKLVEIWSEVLKIEKEEISTTANFFSIGGHSLKASVLTGRIHKETGVEFPLRDVFLHSNIQAQASQINTRDKKDFVSIPKAKDQEYYPLSSAQKRLYLLQEMELESTAYNMPYIIPLGTEAEKEKIEEAFLHLIKRHESFRTSFEMVGEEPVQRIHEQVEFKLEEFEITKEEIQEKRQQFIQAFDLSQAPLLRVSKVNVKGESSLLMIDMHHIISDGVSHAILEQDFQRLYSGEELAPLSLQYKDYSQWQNSEEQQTKVKEQEDYWIRKFEEEIPVLNLPIDKVRPAIQSHEGASVSFALSKAETQQIKSLAKENDLTLYMSVLLSFNILLSKLSGQEDIIVGTPIAGRNHRDLENIVGMFVNTLALRNEVNGSNTLKEFTKKLKQNTLEAFENQDYQFEELVGNISIERDISRNPVFDIMFNFQNQTDTKADLSGLESEQYVHRSRLSKFDLTLLALDYGEQLMLSFEYCTKLFKTETIERYIRYFKQIVNQLTIKSERELSAIEIISKEEKQQLLYDFNDTIVSYPSHKSISQVFDEQVKEFSKKIALEDKDKSYTYQDLDEESNKIANYLIKCGVTEDQFVGLLSGRSSDMIIGILGILKTGGAYVPIDPAYPIERVNHLIQDSGINIILSTEVIDLEYDFAGDIINIDDLEIKESSTNLNLPSITSSNIAYVMYTSGSTGKPKGVVIEQKSVLRLVQNNQFFPFHSEEKILLTGAPVFDATTFEIWGALLNGGSLYIASNEVIINSELLGECIRKNIITSLWLTSSLFNQLVDQDESIFDTLKFLLVGGDVLSVKHINKIKTRNSELVLINGYGPTENTTFSTTFNIDKEYESNIPIGKPISNSMAYIFDKSNRLQAVGVSGELLVGGDGLAREYLNNPELTREKFIENPYKEGERLYRTGDLARWLPDGNIEFLGRIDQQVKIRGFRIELGEIENVLQKQQSINESVVLAREENGDKYLCAYLVTDENFKEDEIRTYLSVRLPDYMIPSYFVELDKIPLTSNGKVNRKALPSPEIKAGDDYVAPSNAIEEKLVEIWSEVLKIEKEEISTTANFFSIGGHSLKAAACINKLNNKFNVNIPLLEIFKNPTILQLAEFIYINKSPKGIDDNHLVLLKAGDVNGENIFLIHDGSGDVDGYIEFCKQANDGINYWGIMAGSLKKYQPINITIEQLAIRYITSLKKVQKQGKYSIAGWSLGGTIAFEMIRQLEQEKEKVRFFGIIDSMPPNVNEEAKIKEFTVESELDWIRKYFDDQVIAGLNTGIDLKDFWVNVIAYLKNIAGASEILKYEIVKNIGFEIKEYEKVSIEDLVKFMNFTRSLRKASYNYYPENVINSQINYLAAIDSKQIITKNWQEFSKKDIIIKEVQGTHFTIFKQPNVKDFYKQFMKSYKNIEKKTLV
ncbi:MAG: amino acid adenylation domain-containing protein [Bacteroidales bacterium]|nr:amino acid adenylation domain-containing protein [Bacteroidales bacterium]